MGFHVLCTALFERPIKSENAKVMSANGTLKMDVGGPVVIK